MTPVVLAIALAVVAAVVVVVLAAVVTGSRPPALRDVVSSVRAGIDHPREVFTTDDLADDEVGHVDDIFVVGRPADPDDEGLGQVLGKVGARTSR